MSFLLCVETVVWGEATGDSRILPELYRYLSNSAVLLLLLVRVKHLWFHIRIVWVVRSIVTCVQKGCSIKIHRCSLQVVSEPDDPWRRQTQL